MSAHVLDETCAAKRLRITEVGAVDLDPKRLELLRAGIAVRHRPRRPSVGGRLDYAVRKSRRALA